MRHIEIPIPAGADADRIECAIDSAIQFCGLHTTLRGTLKQHSGCIHWHLKNSKQRGTLEITWWPSKGRAWFTIQSGRTARWIDDRMKSLANTICSAIE